MKMRLVTIVCYLVSVIALLTPTATEHGCISPVPAIVPGTVVQPPATHAIIVINEVLLTPHSTWNCSELAIYSATSDAWVELYNPQSQAFDLNAVHAALDSGPQSNAFYLPPGSRIPAHGFLVLFPRTSPLFLSSERMTLRLLIAGVAVDQVNIPSLAADMAFARIPDGSTSWQITSNPTIAGSNVLPAITHVVKPRHATTTARSKSPHRTTTSRQARVGKAQGNSNAVTGAGMTAGDSPSTSPSSPGDATPSSSLHTPGVPTPAPGPGQTSTTPAHPVATAVTQVTTNNDLIRKILLTMLCLALAIALYWCRKLFRTGR